MDVLLLLIELLLMAYAYNVRSTQSDCGMWKELWFFRGRLSQHSLTNSIKFQNVFTSFLCSKT